MLKDDVVAAIDKLPVREREILKLKHKLGDGYQYTDDEVAHIFKTDIPTIQRLEQEALAKVGKILVEQAGSSGV